MGDQAEAERDSEVAEVERIAGQRVRAARVQLCRDQLLVLTRGAVRDLTEYPRAQGLAGDAEREAGDEPERRGRAAAAPEQEQRHDQQRHRREAAPAEQQPA